MSGLSEAEIKALIAKVRSIKKRVNVLLKKDSTTSSNELTRIADIYNGIREYLCSHLNEIGQHMPRARPPFGIYGPIPPSEARPTLTAVLIGCETAEEGLEALLKSRLEPEVLDKLESYRKKLTRLEEEGLDINVVKTLRVALSEAKCGHWLASAIISSRVIDYVKSQIKGEKDEDKIKFLVDNNIIPKKNKKLQELLLRTLKLHRDFSEHRVDTFPEVDEALMMLGGALAFAKILLKLKSS